MKNHVQWKTVSGQPVVVADRTLIPQSRALTVRFSRWLWVWRRPTAVRVEQHGRVRVLPIIDLTRRLQLGLLGVGVVLVAIVGVVQFARNIRNAQTIRGKENRS